VKQYLIGFGWGRWGVTDQLPFLPPFAFSSCARPLLLSRFTYLLYNPHLPHLVSVIRLI
jgi:hypothetical protein